MRRGELRPLGDPLSRPLESLDACIAIYAEATCLAGLISRILTRLCKTHDPAAVRHICAALVLSQIGLTESELSVMARTDAATVAGVLGTLEPITLQRAGTLMADVPLRDAILLDFDVSAGHRVLANFFSSVPMDKRVLRELPMHLERCQDFPALMALMATPSVLMEMFHDHKSGECISFLSAIRYAVGKDAVPAMFDMSLYLADNRCAMTLCRVFGLLGYYKETQGILTQLLKQPCPTPKLKSELLHRMAMADVSLGNYAKAEENARAAFQIRQDAKLDVFLQMDTSRLIALSMKKQGKYEAALKLYRSLVAQAQQKLDPLSSKLAHFYEETGDILRKIGSYTEAASFHTKALEIKKKTLGEHNVATAMAYFDLAKTHKKQGKYAEAMKEVDFSIASFEKVYGSAHPTLAPMLNTRASLLRKANNYDEAHALYLRVIAMNEALLGSDHVDTAEGYVELGLCLKKQGAYTEAHTHTHTHGQVGYHPGPCPIGNGKGSVNETVWPRR